MPEYMVYGLAKVKVDALVIEADNPDEALVLANEGNFHNLEIREVVDWEFHKVESND